MRKVMRDRARLELERRVRWYRRARLQARPPEGWLRAMRLAVGIPAEQIANKMRLSYQDGVPCGAGGTETEDSAGSAGGRWRVRSNATWCTGWCRGSGRWRTARWNWWSRSCGGSDIRRGDNGQSSVFRGGDEGCRKTGGHAVPSFSRQLLEGCRAKRGCFRFCVSASSSNQGGTNGNRQGSDR